MGDQVPGPEGARARARSAILAVVRAEVGGYGSRQRLYETALQAYQEAHPALPADEVCAACYGEITHHTWLNWGQDAGIPEADCGPSKAYFWRVAERLGFTARYAKYDIDDEPNSTSGIEEANSLISEEHEGPVPRGSEAARAAILEMREALSVVYRQLRAHDAEELAGKADVETLVTEARAISANLRDLCSDQRLVPANMHPIFIMLLSAVANADALGRRTCAEIKSRSLDSRRKMTRKSMANIAKGRYSRVPICVEPRRAVIAIMRGYHGMRCPACGSRRTVPDTDSRSCATVHCLHCADGASHVAPDWVTCRACHSPIEDPAAVDCAQCGEPTRLPPGLEGGSLLAP